MNLQSMSASRFVGPFLASVQNWEKGLSLISEVSCCLILTSTTNVECCLLFRCVMCGWWCRGSGCIWNPYSSEVIFGEFSFKQLLKNIHYFAFACLGISV